MNNEYKLKNNDASIWRKYHNYFIGGSLTLFIISILIILSPVSAIELALQPNDTDIYANESITFFGKIDIESDEFIPVKNITFFIPISQITCIFYPNGTEISGCDNITILPNGLYSEKTGDLISHNPEYDYGYGLGFEYSETQQYELEYNISFTPEDIGMPINSYSAYLEISTGIFDTTGLQTIFNVIPYEQTTQQSSGGGTILPPQKTNNSLIKNNTLSTESSPTGNNGGSNRTLAVVAGSAITGLFALGYLIKKAILVSVI